MITPAPPTVRLALFQEAPLWAASLWAKILRRSIAERARPPTRDGHAGEGVARERIPCGAFVIIR